MSDDLITWLQVQLVEDERVAKAAAEGGRWHYEPGESVGAWTLYDEHWNIASLTTYRYEDYDYSARMPAFRHPAYVDADANGAHIARHDPARVLAEVEAKRAVLDAYVQRESESDLPGAEVFGYHATGLLIAIKHLALPYADREGYREDWRP